MMSQSGPLPMFGFFKINFILYLICITWVIILVITPMVEPHDSVHFGPLGYTGLDEHYQEIEDLENPFNKVVYHSGDRMCHMREPRTLIINGNQMSYCSRCFGIFLGLAIGAAITTFVVIDLKWWLLLSGLIPIGLDGGLQLITPYESNNVLRLFTGSLFGVVTMLALGLVMVEMSHTFKNWMIYKMNYAESEKIHSRNKEIKAKNHSKKSKR